MKIIKKCGKIALFIMLSIMVIYLGFNAVLGIRYYDFYEGAKSVGTVAGIDDGFVPQGIDAYDGYIISSGYMKDDSASRIYLSKDGEERYVELYFEDGTPYTRHAGGITHAGEYIYVAGSGNKTFDVFLLADVMSGAERATLIGTVPAFTAPAWVTSYNGYIFAGSFAQTGGDSYKPKKNETLTTPTGEVNVSMITVFKLDENAEFGINPVPVAAISSGERVQGACFAGDGRLITSTSYGLSTSTLYFYNIDKAGFTATHTLGKTDSHEGYTVPLYYLDGSSLTYELDAIPMAEEIIVLEDRVYIMNESACHKYLFGNLIGGRALYAYEINDAHFKK